MRGAGASGSAAAAAPQQLSRERPFVEFVGLRGRLLRLPAHDTLASALARLRAALSQDDPTDELPPYCCGRVQLCVPSVQGAGWRELSPPLSFSPERLKRAPQLAEALNAGVALPLPTCVCARVLEPDDITPRWESREEVAVWPGESANLLLARLFGCDLDCALHDVLHGAAVALVSVEAAAPPLIRPPCADSDSLAAVPGEPDVTVHVRTLTGSVCSVLLGANAPILALQLALEEKLGVPASQQRIFFAGAQLPRGQTLREAGVTDGDTLHLLLHLRGGCGENFAMICSPDPWSPVTPYPAMARHATGYSLRPPASHHGLISLEVAVITADDFPGHMHVQSAMRQWATASDAFALRVEALPRLAWERPAGGGAATSVWHADVLVALMICLKRRGCTGRAARCVARFAALPAAQWFAGGAVLPGRTVLSSRREAGRLVSITARFQPAAPLPAGRLRVSAPSRHANVGIDRGPTWPAVAWYVQLAEEGQSHEGGQDASVSREDDAEARATLLFWNY